MYTRVGIMSKMCNQKWVENLLKYRKEEEKLSV